MPQRYFNRDLSWLWFNHRVLEEAKNESLPLYERIKFLAIYSNNLEEFYRVRVSYYRNLIRELPAEHPKIAEVKPAEIIQKINALVSKFQDEFSRTFRKTILPELTKNGIILLKSTDTLSEAQAKYAKKIFSQSILPTLEPMLLVKRRIQPFLKTGQPYVVLKLFKKGWPSWLQRPCYGLIKVPIDHDIPRFIELGEENGKFYMMFLENVITRFIHKLFPGYKYIQAYNVKTTRDADIEYDDFEGEDLIDAISNLDLTREIGRPNRFQYDSRMPKELLEFLKIAFRLDDRDLVRGGAIHNFRDFFSLPNPLSPKLESPKHTPLRVPELDQSISLLEAFKEKEYMLHFPYHSYNYFINFLNEAATSPDVIEIKATQYRVANKSAVVDALINAAENGKKVTVFVELKARFDEQANLAFAKEMKKAGINIIYSLPGLKVHSKVAMVLRKNDKDEVKGTAFIGTGNFNESTARMYVDHGFFTSDDAIIKEIHSLFDYFGNQNLKPQFKEILVPGFNMIDTYKRLIAQEIANAKKGKLGYMLLKMNGLEDPIMIEELYRASTAGVKIDLIIRGACRLIPGQEFSKNIHVMRIVDSFLEHDRVCLFHNNGNEVLYAGSADWMRRNLYRRIECVIPVKDQALKQEMIDLLNIQLQDNVNGRVIGPDMKNYKFERSGKPVRSQKEIYNYLKAKSGSDES